MRRATIYAMRDPVIARCAAEERDGPRARHDHRRARVVRRRIPDRVFKQASAIREIRDPERHAWAAVDETLKVDGYNWVKKAMSMTAPNAEMEFAASLMTQGALSAEHRAKAVAAAPKELAAWRRTSPRSRFKHGKKQKGQARLAPAL